MPDDFRVTVQAVPSLDVVAGTVDIPVVAAATLGPPGAQGPPGPPGPQGEATTPVIVLTQAEYDALTPPDPESLYVIVS